MKIWRYLFLVLALLSPHAQAGDLDTRVVIPWTDFKILYEKGQAPAKPPEKAPRDAAISKASWKGQVEGESVLLTVTFRVDLLKGGWVSVPLLPTTVGLRDARIGKEQAAIYLDNGWYTLVTNRTGSVDVVMDVAVALWESNGVWGFSASMPPSAATSLELSVPGPDALAFSVAGAQQVVSRSEEGKQLLVASLPASGSLSVSWQRKVSSEQAASQAARIYVEHHALVGVGEGLVSCSSTLNYAILHTRMDTLSFSLPSEVSVVEVKGKGIRDWKVSDQGSGRQQVAVKLNFEAEGDYSLYVDYELAVREGNARVRVPDLRVDGVERVRGWIGVDVHGTLEVRPGEVQGASSIDVRELPTAILGQTDHPVLLGFRYRKDGFSIPLEIHQHAPVDLLVTLIDRADATTVMTPDGRRMTRVRYAMRNNRAQFLRLTMPGGAQTWSTFVGGRAVKPALGDDGRLMIPLVRSQLTGSNLAQFEVELTYVEDGSAPNADGRGKVEASLPIADVPATLYTWTFYAPEQAKIAEKDLKTTLRPVEQFTRMDTTRYATRQGEEQLQRQAAAQVDSAAGQSEGLEPVAVTLPLDGQQLKFEKLLVLGEPLTLSFQYKGLESHR